MAARVVGSTAWLPLHALQEVLHCQGEQPASVVCVRILPGRDEVLTGSGGWCGGLSQVQHGAAWWALHPVLTAVVCGLMPLFSL